MSSLQQATLSRPTGFSDRPVVRDAVSIVGFVWGRHLDALGYDRPGECPLAVVVTGKGRFEAVPLHWLTPPISETCSANGRPDHTSAEFPAPFLIDDEGSGQ